VRLVPAILTGDIENFRKKLALAESLTDYAQVDFMDGRFVPSISVPSNEVASVKTGISLEAHLMVKDPISVLAPLENTSFVKANFHFEATEDHYTVINRIRALNMKVGLAVNPGTEIESFSGLIEEVDSVLFLAVDPGFYGSTFQPEVLDKLRSFRLAYPEKEVGIDGGIKLANLDAVISARPDFIYVGSAIFNSPQPPVVFKEFKDRILSIAGSAS